MPRCSLESAIIDNLFRDVDLHGSWSAGGRAFCGSRTDQVPGAPAGIVDRASRSAIIAQNGCSLFSTDVPLNRYPSSLQSLCPPVRLLPFVEAAFLRIRSPCAAHELPDTGPRNGAKAHGTRLRARYQRKWGQARGTQVVVSGFFLRKCQCHDLRVKQGAAARKHQVDSGGQQGTVAHIKDGRSERASGPVLYIQPRKLDDKFHLLFRCGE